MLRFFHGARRAALPATVALGMATSACTSPGASWQLISPKGFPLANHRAGALLFLDDTTGLLLGSAWSEEAARTNTIPTEQVSTVFRTTDGGHNWQLNVIGKGRRFSLATRIGRTAYAVEVQPGTGPSPRDTSQLLRSTDAGLSWQPLGRVPGQVLTVSFADTLQGFVRTSGPQHPGKTLLYHTTDGGRRWQPARLQRNVPVLDGVAAPNGTAWLLLPPPEQPPGNLAASLAHVDWRSGAVTVEAIPGGNVGAPPRLDAAGNLWLVRADPDGSARLLRRAAGTGRYTELHRFAPGAGEHLRPVTLHEDGGTVSLLLTADAPQRPAYRFYHSPDKGHSWQQERLPIGSEGQPYAFFGPERVWLSTGRAQLQVRAPRR